MTEFIPGLIYPITLFYSYIYLINLKIGQETMFPFYCILWLLSLKVTEFIPGRIYPITLFYSYIYLINLKIGQETKFPFYC